MWLHRNFFLHFEQFSSSLELSKLPLTQGFYAAIPLSLTRAGISVIPIPTLITIGNVGLTVSPGSELFPIRLEADRDGDWTLYVRCLQRRDYCWSDFSLWNMTPWSKLMMHSIKYPTQTNWVSLSKLTTSLLNRICSQRSKKRFVHKFPRLVMTSKIELAIVWSVLIWEPQELEGHTSHACSTGVSREGCPKVFKFILSLIA